MQSGSVTIQVADPAVADMGLQTVVLVHFYAQFGNCQGDTRRQKTLQVAIRRKLKFSTFSRLPAISSLKCNGC
jgi:hypothetical protein